MRRQNLFISHLRPYSMTPSDETCTRYWSTNEVQKSNHHYLHWSIAYRPIKILITSTFINLSFFFFIKCNSYLRRCPIPGCSSVIRVKRKESRPVTCGRGHTFCFNCRNDFHDPFRCSLLLKWMTIRNETFNQVIIYYRGTVHKYIFLPLYCALTLIPLDIEMPKM